MAYHLLPKPMTLNGQNHLKSCIFGL